MKPNIECTMLQVLSTYSAIVGGDLIHAREGVHIFPFPKVHRNHPSPQSYGTVGMFWTHMSIVWQENSNSNAEKETARSLHV